MRTDLDFLAQLRAEVRNALPENTFLQLDRGDALFIAGAPIAIPGLSVMPRGKLFAIAPTETQLRAFEVLYPKPIGDLSRSVFRSAYAPVTPEVITLFAKGLKLMSVSTPPSVRAYDRSVRQYIAASLRESTPIDTYAPAIIADILTDDLQL